MAEPHPAPLLWHLWEPQSGIASRRRRASSSRSRRPRSVSRRSPASMRCSAGRTTSSMNARTRPRSSSSSGGRLKSIAIARTVARSSVRPHAGVRAGGRVLGDHDGVAPVGRHPTLLWARDPDVAEEVNTEHTNGGYLPGFALNRKADRHRRPRGGRPPRRAADRRRADVGGALDDRDGGEVDPPVDPDRQPVQGARAEDVAADDAGHRRGRPGPSRSPPSPGRTSPARSWPGRPRRRDRHRGSLGRRGDPARAHPRAVPRTSTTT